MELLVDSLGYSALVAAIELFHWNPRRPLFRGSLGRRLPFRKPPIKNFGDLSGPIIAQEIVSRRGLTEPAVDRRLFSVGSVMHFTEPGDVVWGTGINGKVAEPVGSTHLDVRAVRGPLTRATLIRLGISVPEIFGDPAILWSQFWPREHYVSDERGQTWDVSVVPNFHDLHSIKTHHNVISPLGNPHEIVSRISRSSFVVASSLHGIVLAESFGIPARLIVPGTESLFKYEDYYLGTGRAGFQPAGSIEEAIALGGEPPHSCDTSKLLASFPADLWGPPDHE